MKPANTLLYVRADALIAEDFGAGALLLDSAGNRVMELNESGAAIWRALEKPLTTAAMADLLADIYGPQPDGALETDAAVFVKAALKSGIVKTYEPRS